MMAKSLVSALAFFAAVTAAAAQDLVVTDVKQLTGGYAYIGDKNHEFEHWTIGDWSSCLAKCTGRPDCTAALLAFHGGDTAQCFSLYGSYFEKQVTVRDPNKLFRAYAGSKKAGTGSGNIASPATDMADTVWFTFPGWSTQGFDGTAQDIDRSMIVSESEFSAPSANGMQDCRSSCSSSTGAKAFSAVSVSEDQNSGKSTFRCTCLSRALQLTPVNQRLSNDVATSIPVLTDGIESSQMANVVRDGGIYSALTTSPVDVHELTGGYAYFMSRDNVSRDWWTTDAWESCLASCRNDAECTSVMLADHEPLAVINGLPGSTGRCFRSKGEYVERAAQSWHESKIFRAFVGDKSVFAASGNVFDNDVSLLLGTRFFSFPGWTADAALDAHPELPGAQMYDTLTFDMYSASANLDVAGWTHCRTRCSTGDGKSFSVTGGKTAGQFTLIHCTCFSRPLETKPLNRRLSDGLATAVVVKDTNGWESSRIANIIRNPAIYHGLNVVELLKLAPGPNLAGGRVYFTHHQVPWSHWDGQTWDACKEWCLSDAKCTSVILSGFTQDPQDTHTPKSCYINHGSSIEEDAVENVYDKVFRAYLREKSSFSATGNVDGSSILSDTVFFPFLGWSPQSYVGKIVPESRFILDSSINSVPTASLTGNSYASCRSFCAGKGAAAWSFDDGKKLDDGQTTETVCICLSQTFEDKPANTRDAKTGFASSISVRDGFLNTFRANIVRS